MSRGVLLALLVLAGCGRSPSVPGIERIDGAPGAQAFDWSPESRRLAFVEGRFPSRTYLVVRGRSGSARSRLRLKGYVLGRGLALSRDGRTVLLDAGKLGKFDSREEPDERVVLAVDADRGFIVSEIPVGRDGAAALGRPAWSQGPVAAWTKGRDELAWRSFGVDGASGAFRGPAAWKALLLDEPYLVVSERQTQRPRMVVYDLRAGAPTAEWRVALTGAPLAVRPGGGALSVRWMPETGQFVLESGDPKTGRRSPLLEAEGEIESAVETDRGLYAIAKDPTRRNATGRAFLAPRVLMVAEHDGRRWSVPWTSRPGRFLGVDPADGRLLFAVTDQDKPAAWAISPDRSVLASAGAVIDGAY